MKYLINNDNVIKLHDSLQWSNANYASCPKERMIRIS